MTKHHLKGRLTRLCEKELKETLRDRRTITTLLLMPLLVYPLLSMALNRFLLSAPVTKDTAFKIGVTTPLEGALLREWINNDITKPPKELVDSSDGNISQFTIGTTEPTSARDALQNNDIDVACEITIDGQPLENFVTFKLDENGEFPQVTDVWTQLMSQDLAPSVKVTSFSGDVASESSARILVERLQWLKMKFAILVAQRTSGGYQQPIEVQFDEIGEVKSPSMLGTIVPLVLVLMTITGAVYPAIDLTAGERERGTMESLMASPVPRSYVLIAKYVAVVTVALLTAVANLLAMFSTLWAGGLLPLLTGQDSFPWLQVLQILGLLVLFSGFFSAVLLSLTSFAKSFKEAQAYLIPVMLLSLTPGMLSLMPGVTLKGPLAIAPLVNIVVLARDVLQGTVDPAPALAAIVSTFAYAAAALGIASTLFGTDAVTRSSQQTFTSLFRRPEQKHAVPTIQSATLMLALLVPIYFLVSNGLMRYLASEEVSATKTMIINAIALTITFGLVPLFVTWASRSQLTSTYRLTNPSFIAIIGAAIAGLGTWGAALESYLIADRLGIAGISEEKIAQGMRMLDVFKEVSPVILIITAALTPAIIEEFCFRGFLFSALSKTLSPWRVITITALLFGTFHVLTGNALMLERFVPTTLLGFLLGWIAYRAGSVIPGIFLHFVHNAFVELFAHFHEQFTFLGDDLGAEAHLPTEWLICSTVVAAVGILIIFIGTKSPKLSATTAHD